MAGLVIINGSPRGPKSNSKRYISLFKDAYRQESVAFSIAKNNHQEIWNAACGCTDILLVFPLYVDGIPATLLDFLKSYPEDGSIKNANIHVIVNCGFIEPKQNAVAVEMIKLFCKQNGLPFGTCLCIGGGEAILDTPFAFLAKRKLARMAKLIQKGIIERLHVSMPLTGRMFVRAASAYWLGLGKANGLTQEQLSTMNIE